MLKGGHMTAAQLIPAPDPLQVPWGWFQLFLSATGLLHFLVMNCMLGFAIIAFTNHFRGSGVEDENRLIGSKLPILIAFTVNIGIAPLLFLQVLYGHIMYATQVLMAVWSFSIIIMLLVGYYSAYIYDMRFERLGRYRVLFSGLVACILLAIAFITSVNMSFMVRVDGWFEYFDRPEGLLLNLGDPTLFPRFLHFVLASVAVGSLILALYYDFRQRKGDSDAALHVAPAMKRFTSTTLANIGIGFWFFLSMPKQARPMTGDLGILFICGLTPSIVLALLLLVLGWKKKVRLTAWTLLVTIIFMTFTREVARVSALSPWFAVKELEVIPQYSPFIAFLLIFIFGLWMAWYMIRLVIRDKEVRS